MSSSGIHAALPSIRRAAGADGVWTQVADDLEYLSRFSDSTPTTVERVDAASRVAGACTTLAGVAVSAD